MRSAGQTKLLSQLLAIDTHLSTILMPKVTFIYNGEMKEVEGEAGKTILEIAIENDIPMEHACGGNGFCTTCMCKVKKGKENLSDRNEREENMGVINDPDRLGCQAKVEGDVEIEMES
jgi:ferredoxin